MKIKNIRQFRSIIKKEIAGLDYPNRNENFVGVSVVKDGVNSEYGFFSIYHGLKKGYNGNDGVRGFLKGFLDMASDGQAVYEFMQNAVDARSSKFCLFWDEDEIDGGEYLLVVNNGDMFDADGIQSILNIGISTKASDSYSIGKFGIGFKLAHRLVGKENGLDELINKNYGPVLFSWENSELNKIASLTEFNDVYPINFDYKVIVDQNEKRLSINSEEPWLFKILLTNFPCQPENNLVPEIIQDYKNIETSSGFSKKEFVTLKRWVNKYSSYFEEGFNKGSLFFIKLGQGKKVHLEENNLEEGVRFSLAILNRIAFQSLGHSGLNDIILRGVPLSPIDLEFEPFIIEKGSNDFRLIRFGKTTDLTELEIAIEETDANIEILIGYTDYKNAYEAFKNAPNFYLFFPLSEEKHNLRFIIHSNAFYKGTARTHLQKGNSGEGINERLLNVLTRLLIQRLIKWSSSENKVDKEKFIGLYANLLLSNESDNPERVWVNEPLWKPILKFMECNIPVKDFTTNSFKLVNEVTNIRVKNTILPVDKENWTAGKIEWFYWNSSEIELCSEATRKLNIERYCILDLLLIKDISTKLNLWLKETNYNHVSFILNELNCQSLLDVKEDIFWNNLGLLKIWEFEDGFFSIEDIGKEDEYSKRLILFDTLDSIKGELIKSGWILSINSLNEYSFLFTQIKKYFQAVIKYIRSYEELINVLNIKLPIANLTKLEKLNIVNVIAKKLINAREERIGKLRELILFRNKLGVAKPLKSLLNDTQISWLNSSCIHSEDNDLILEDYLSTTPIEIYQNIIYLFWSEIVHQYSSLDDIHSLFEYAIKVYSQNSNLPVLSDKEIVRLGNSFFGTSASFYYSPSLLSLSESEYHILESVFKKFKALLIPNYELLKYYEEKTFKIATRPLNLSIDESIHVTLDEAKVFLKLCTKVDSELFQTKDITQIHENEFLISNKIPGIEFVVSGNILINKYILDYHPNLFKILPEKLFEFCSQINLQGFALINRLVLEYKLDNEKQLSALIEIALQSEIESKKLILNSISNICFNLNMPLPPESVSVRFVKLLSSVDVEEFAIGNIKKKTTIISGCNTIILSEVQLFGEDEIIFEEDEKKYSLSLSSILPSKDSNATKIVGQLTEKLTALGISEKNVLDKIFGLTGNVDRSYIANQIKEKYTDQVLLNAHQLAFVLHYSSLNPKTFPIESFKIETKIGAHHLKNIVTYTSNCICEFIPDNLVLHSKYDGLSKLLIKDGTIYKANVGIVICNRPYLDGNRLLIPGVNKIEVKENQLLLLKFLFEKWKEVKEPLSNISLSEEKKWIDLIGFEPSLTITGSDLIIDTEKLPEFVQFWLDKLESELNSKEKCSFLKSLGVSFAGSDIIRVRSYLVGVETIKPGINYNLPEVLVQNTLKLLEKLNSLFEIHGSQIEFLKDLFQRLIDNSNYSQIPLPIIDVNNPDTIILNKVSDAVVIDENIINRLSEIGYEIQQLPEVVEKSIIYTSLFRDVVNLKKYFNPIQLEFDVIDNEAISKNGVEWNRNFYQQWRVNNLTYKIVSYPDKMPYMLTYLGQTIYKYNKNDSIFIKNEIIVGNDKNDRSIIALIETNNYLPESIFLQLKELFIKFDDSIQDFLNRIQSNPKLADEFEKLKKKEEIEHKKKELTDNFGTSTIYSMLWFMNLLELMVMSGGGTNIANPQGNIVFNEIEFNPDDLRLITLKNPSKSISPSIDLFTDFNATFHYFDVTNIKRSKQIKISGLSKKGHEVVVIPTNPNDLSGINLSCVREVELTFVRYLDLINKLTNAFKDLKFENDYNLKTELTENINFIFGPPGTGKTTEISKQVIQKIANNESKNILILTPTNKAADVLVKKILDLANDDTYPDGWLVRFGASSDLELLDRGIVYDGNSFKFNLYDKCVVVTTIQRFPYERIITHEDSNGEIKTRISDIPWDTIIFDEASMIMLPAIVYPLYKRKYKTNDEDGLTEFIIGGDPLQIPPIYDISNSDLGEDNEDVKEENIYTMVGLNSFDETVQVTISNYGNKILNLPTQYRSIEAIGTIFSKFQYGGILKHGRNENKGGSPDPRPLPDYFKQLGFRPITIIRYPVNESDSIFNPQKLNGSPYHLYISFLINEMILKFRKMTVDNWDIGVIAPYRSQATLINRLIESHKDKSKLNILTDTVHGFQGGESDLVFAVFNPSSVNSSNSRFLQKEFIINVAISRAKDYLFIFIPDHDNYGFKKLRFFHESFPNSLLEIIQHLPQNMVANLEAGQIEKAIMGKSNYFQEHSFTNVHQDVNIYSDLYKDYIIKVNEEAIDIHLKVE